MRKIANNSNITIEVTKPVINVAVTKIPDYVSNSSKYYSDMFKNNK